MTLSKMDLLIVDKETSRTRNLFLRRSPMVSQKVCVRTEGRPDYMIDRRYPTEADLRLLHPKYYLSHGMIKPVLEWEKRFVKEVSAERGALM